MMIKLYLKKKSLLVGVLLLAGCEIGPDYERPKIDISENWSEKINQSAPFSEDIKWWKNFNDPILTALIHAATESNLDLKVSEAKIAQSRSLVKSAEAGLFPQFSLSGALTHRQNSRNAYTSPQQSLGKRFYDLYRGELDTSWEIDLFGRLRRAEESAVASLDLSISDAHGVFLALIADIAQNYITLRSTQQQLRLAQKSYEKLDKLYRLNQDLQTSGLRTDLAVSQAQASRDAAYAKIFPLQATIQLLIHQLSILLGQEPNHLVKRLEEAKEIPTPPSSIYVGLPSELLERRPDIRSAEEQLKLKTAEIGIAIGDLFPKFTLTGSFGYESLKSSNLFQPRSGFFSFGPGVSYTLFDFGRIRANIESAEALKDQAFHTYKKTVLVALKDVEDSLVKLGKEILHFEHLSLSASSSKAAANLSLKRHQTGLSTFLDVLTAETAYYDNELNKILSQESVALNAVGLFKAVGGGWQSFMRLKHSS